LRSIGETFLSCYTLGRISREAKHMFDLTVEQAFAYRVDYEQAFEWVTK